MKPPRYEDYNWNSRFDPDAPGNHKMAEFVGTLLATVGCLFVLVLLAVAFTPQV